ncbi:hypothetical protein QYH69_07860 [Paraburkholderia sp. SARCC-3016]|uniref:hypothetical protein n=1 Tax=Paraburkholderia sp. SARCC-3016 TaxID=3058611 RepID=UPI002808F33A|nr:hypothetical protein [Paraburkholderia sp. SARCC-3016]MDQ7977161.1 hypothetical protein [Paraburkholderia sp. SARCC-3016]
MSGSSRRQEPPQQPDQSFQDWLVECATRYARSDDAPEFFSFDDDIDDWLMLHGCGLTPAEALLRMFGALH